MNTSDQRVTLARKYLAGAGKHGITELSPTMLARELTETRRLLGQVLDIVDETAKEAESVFLAPEQRPTVLAALDAAAEDKHDRIAACPDCDGDPAAPCATCQWRLQIAGEYDQLAALIRGDQ